MIKKVLTLLLVCIAFLISQTFLNQLQLGSLTLFIAISVLYLKIPKIDNLHAYAIIFLFSFSLLFSAGLFDFTGPPLFADHPVFQYSLTKVSENFAQGTSMFYDNETFTGGRKVQTILAPNTWILNIFESQIVVYRLTLAFAFILPCIGLYSLVRKKVSAKTSLISVLLWLAFPHHNFLTGRFTAYLAIGFGLFALTLNQKNARKQLSSIIFLVLSLIYNQIVGAWFLIITLAISFFKKRKFSALSSAILTLFLFQYLFAQGSGLVEYNTSIMEFFYPFLFQFNDMVFNLYLKHSIALILLGTLSIIAVKQDRTGLLMLFVSIFMLSFGFFGGVLGQAVLKYGAFLLRVSLIPITALIIEKGNKILNSYAIFTICFYTFYLFTCWSNPQSPLYQEVNGFTLWEAERLDMESGILSYHPNQRFESLVGMINLLPDTPDSRILLENSFNREFGGYSPILLPELTNRTFLGEEYPLSSLLGRETFSEGLFLGKPIKEYSNKEIDKVLQAYNIKYIIVWTEDYEQKLSQNPNLKLMGDAGFSKTYEYLNSRESFSEPEGTTNWKNNHEFDFITSGKKDETVQLSFSKTDNLKAFYESEEIDLMEDEFNLIVLKLPKNGDQTITFVYQ